MNEQSTTIDRPRYAVRAAIEAVKDAVGVAAYSATLTELHGVGNKLRGRCPIHGGDNPQSFAVYSDEGRWHCYRCDRGGDVIDLCQAAEGGELWEAVVSLSLRFNVDLPQRPPQWFERQDEKGRIRSAARKYIASVYQRRLTRLYAPLALIGGETPEEELRALEGLASSLWPVSLDMAGRRVSGEE
jgi:DNA primase